MSTWSLAHLLSTASILGAKRTYSVTECEASAKSMGLSGGFPPSYVEFMRHFGSGEWKPGLYIYVPTHPLGTATISSASLNLKNMLLDRFANNKYSDKAVLVKSLVPFGSDGSGHVFCWDLTSRCANGEMAVSVVEEEYMKMAKCGSDIFDFIGSYWIERGLDRVMPFDNGSWGGDAVFLADGDK